MTLASFHRSRPKAYAPVHGALRRAGLAIALVTSGLAAFWTTAETFSDPGGWAAAGWVALWLVPLAGLGLAAWLRPARAAPVLAAAVAAFVAAAAWSAVAADSWRTFTDAHGPVLAVAAMALLAPLALLAFHHPLDGGLLLAVVGATPVILRGVAHVAGGAALAALAVPVLACAVLFVLAARGAPDA